MAWIKPLSPLLPSPPKAYSSLTAKYGNKQMDKKKQMALHIQTLLLSKLQSQPHLVSTDLGIELGSIIRLLITVYFN